jgi:hypothetical protein
MLRTFLAIASLLVLAPALADDAPGEGPKYSTFVDILKRAEAVRTDMDQLKVIAKIRSRDPKVKPSDITLEAKLKSGQVVSIAIAADGAFTLPSSPGLAEEDPPFVANQPKGTMEVSVTFEIKAPAVAAQRYADLMRGLVQSDMVMKRMGVFQGPKAHGLLFVFDGGDHTLTLHSAKGTKVFNSESWEQARKHLKAELSDDGKSTYIYVPMDDDILDENPPTTFDALPAQVRFAH